MDGEGLLILGFGGPQPGCCGRRADCHRAPGCEAACFVAGILGDDPAQAGRIAAVADHYHHFGGHSPYNRLAAGLADALAAELARRGRQPRIALGFRHWTPWIASAAASLADRPRTAALVLAPHVDGRGLDAYRRAAGRDDLRWTRPFHDHPGLAAATAARLRQATLGWSRERLEAAALVFTAHAIPQPAERTGSYRADVAASAAAAAAAFGSPHHLLAFQSAPGGSPVPWSEPTLAATLDQLAATGVQDVLVQPIGFLVDHVEVLYDLDVSAQHAAQRRGLRLTRAATAGDHPALVAALADRVEEALS
jgi:ferrochelatase